MMNAKGFTLVELLIVAVLTVVVAGGLLTAFLTGQSSYFSADAYVQVQQEARRAFDAMVRELREAGPSAAAQPMISLTGATQLNFQVAMDYTADAIVWGDGQLSGLPEKWVHYALVTNSTLSQNNQGQLLRCTDENQTTAIASPVNAVPANCRVLANNVLAPAGGNLFTLDGPPATTVTISLQVRYNSGLLPGGFQSIGGTTPLTSRVRLRNAT